MSLAWNSCAMGHTSRTGALSAAVVRSVAGSLLWLVSIHLTRRHHRRKVLTERQEQPHLRLVGPCCQRCLSEPVVRPVRGRVSGRSRQGQVSNSGWCWAACWSKPVLAGTFLDFEIRVALNPSTHPVTCVSSLLFHRCGNQDSKMLRNQPDLN